MKTKFNGILTLLLALIVQISFAQEKTISGTVSDETGPLPGVNVLKKGTTTGVETDFDGKFSIKANTGDILVFSFVGMKTIEKTVSSSNTMNITMSSDNVLDEVVVTALGISREKKSLGYATQKIDGSQVNEAKTSNFVNSLSGKVAGIDIKQSSTIGGSTNVIIRGYSSITGNNQALFVVDGVPINNNTYNSSDQATGGDGYDYGNAASDINPEDIESINVLKGSAATALYGSRAANGAVIITTKKGTKKKGLGISVSSSLIVGKYDPDTFAEYQDEYGAGYGPFYGSGPGSGFLEIDFGNGTVLTPPTGEDGSFGAAFDPNLMVAQWDSYFPELSSYGKLSPWIAAKNGPSYIFQTSFTDTQNVAISNGGENGSIRFSYTRLNQTGIMPNSKITKNVLDLSGSTNLSDKLTFNGKATYTKNTGLGRYGTGYDAENLMTNFRQWWAVNADLKKQKEAYFATRKNISWNPSSVNSTGPKYWDNPYFTRYENYNNDSRSRFFGYASLNYKINDWLDLLGRATIDTYSELREERNNIGGIDQSEYLRKNINFTELNQDLILNFNKDLSDDFGLAGVLGANYRQTKTNYITAATNGGLILPGIYSLSNSVNPLVFDANSEFDAEVRVLGLFANASFDYKDTYFVEGSLRRDTFSTLPDGNNSFYYPAISTSIIFSNLFESNVISFGKIRASYAEVGNGADPYQLNNTFNPVAGFGGNPLYSNPSTSKNPDLKEERTESKELGLEMSFFGKRLGFDLSLYEQITKDAIIPVEISPTTGFTNTVVNSAEVSNKGLELQLYGTPVKTSNFQWKTNINFSTYKSEVLNLFGDSENILVNSFFGVSLNATKGEPYGTLKGTDYVYLDGEKVVGEDGNYLKTSSRQEILGDINPDWKAGISNMFSYKNFDFSFLIDIQEGGSVFTGDLYFGMATGLYPETAGLNELGAPLRAPLAAGTGSGNGVIPIYDGDDNIIGYNPAAANSGGVILPGVLADGSPNNIRADFTTYANPYGRYGNAPDAQFVYDASYVKLREITFSYNFTEQMLKKLPFTNIKLSATGRNLWIISKDLPYADPEQSFGAGNVQGFQIGAYPAVREYGLNVKLDF
ncbi:SusC/RagA family TonB-linked outer membrane protein [Tenacibaculum ascidiaceicola]|uniref:SusC/RagA family TonB-linked outer membrane protein n=1 Tax=Tenacibaculum ascidiaceicola TaxID=1699411 RepID=UPI003CE50BDD